jgi:predicted house-cleaning noncanonical NTP pyrophosphatase (MazG superfamily)
MKYDKLVRDKIPEIIKADNKNPIIHTADKKEYWKKLKEKLTEEVNEFLKESNEEEFADILEVLHAISDFKNFDKNKVNQIKKAKATKRGRFKDKIILERVD